jgi:putative membrane protein
MADDAQRWKGNPFVRNFVMRVLINTLALWIVSAIFPSLIWFERGGAASYLIAGLALGGANAVLMPILQLFALPLTVVTLGLFAFVVNGIVLSIVAALTNLETGGILAAVIASVLLSITSSIVSTVLGEKKKKG